MRDDLLKNLENEIVYKSHEVILIVDPLDGTSDFIQGNYEGVTVLLGISYKGRPEWGVVHSISD